MLTVDAYRAIGGVAGAISSAAEELYQQLTPTQQEQCRELFANLVTPGEVSSDDTRRRALRCELADIDADLIEQLNNLRLLTFDRDRGDRRTDRRDRARGAAHALAPAASMDRRSTRPAAHP